MIIIECILFGFPDNTNNIITLNYCIIYQKKYNNIDFLSYLSLLKRHLLIEREICTAQSQEHKFIKFNPVLQIFNVRHNIYHACNQYMYSHYYDKPQ